MLLDPSVEIMIRDRVFGTFAVIGVVVVERAVGEEGRVSSEAVGTAECLEGPESIAAML